MTVLSQVLRNARSQLTTALALHPEVAALEAHVLLGHALNKSRAYLLANPEQVLDEATLSPFTDLLSRRLQGEPIAYLVGQREFYGLEFNVTPAVLIPRPETELLVDLALAQLPQQQTLRVLDLGSGSGAIALSLAKMRPHSRVTAVDISPAALTIARLNAERLDIHNIQFVESDWFQALSPDSRFDLIVSNPPYIAQNDPHLLQGDVRFEPIQALRSGADGLQDIRHIAEAARGFLPAQGRLMFEHGYNQQSACADLLESLGYVDIVCHRDLSGQPRVTMGDRPP